MNSDLEQRKKDMAECPVWFLNMLKETSEKAKQNEKSYKEMKGKLDKLVEGTLQWKQKVEKEMGEKLEKKEKEVKELKELLKKTQEQIKDTQQNKLKLLFLLQQTSSSSLLSSPSPSPSPSPLSSELSSSSICTPSRSSSLDFSTPPTDMDSLSVFTKAPSFYEGFSSLSSLFFNI